MIFKRLQIVKIQFFSELVQFPTMQLELAGMVLLYRSMTMQIS